MILFQDEEKNQNVIEKSSTSDSSDSESVILIFMAIIEKIEYFGIARNNCGNIECSDEMQSHLPQSDIAS